MEKQNDTLRGFAFLDDEVWQLSGPDRVKFLNSYNSQDITCLRAGDVSYGAFLTQKGKLVSDAWILQLGNSLLLVLPRGFGAKLTEHLKTYLLFADVLLEEKANCQIVGIWQGETILPNLFGSSFQADIAHSLVWQGHEIQLFPSNRLGPAWEAIIPTAGVAEFRKTLEKADLKEISREALERFRLEAGIPRMGIDMDEDNLVAEVGLDKRATSFNKGCYLGQETTARVNTQGHVNRSLRLVKLERPYTGPLPLEIRVSGHDKTLGRLSSVSPSSRWHVPIGLALIHRLAWENPGELYAEGADGKIRLEKF